MSQTRETISPCFIGISTKVNCSILGGWKHRLWRIRYERYKNNNSVFTAYIMDVNKTAVIWYYCSEYRNAWDVADCIGKY